MKKHMIAKKQPQARNNKSVQKLGLVLGALESQIAPGSQAKPSTCHRVYCLPN